MATTPKPRRMRKLNHMDYLEGAMTPCDNEVDLLDWLQLYAGVRVPTRAVCAHHHAPFDYLRAAYFEPADDLVVWAPRGGGKTRLAAVATLLDLLHKPGIGVRILGGSFVQSLRMWEHLLPDLEDNVNGLLVNHRAGKHTLTLTSEATAGGLRADGSHAAVLTQSERAVRGLRVQRLRCDEVELFDKEVWSAAQLVTKSKRCGDMKVRASVEALSTFHKAYGLMADVVDKAKRPGSRIRLVQWCVLDVLEKCPPERPCASCDLHDECKGIAKTRCDGFFSIDDAIAIKRRSSVETWQAEMLCLRPSQKGCVFRTFDESIHVFNDNVVPPHPLNPNPNLNPNPIPPPEAGSPVTLALDFGYAAPFVCLWIVGGTSGDVHVIDEYVQEQRTMDEHIEHIEARPWGRAKRVACDPAGSGRNEQTAASNVQVLRSRGYSVRTRHSRIVDGLEMIRAALKPAAGKPTLFIHERCARLIKAMRSYHYAEGGSELPVKDGEHDHLVDALRYWFVNRSGTEVTTRLY